MVKCIKQILDKSELVGNNPVNLHQTKLDKSKLVLKNPFYSLPSFYILFISFFITLHFFQFFFFFLLNMFGLVLNPYDVI